MNWITNFVRPKIQAWIKESSTPENMWSKCPGCEHMLFRRDLEKNNFVCHHCNYHLQLGVEERLQLIYGNNTYNLIDLPKTKDDPIQFKDLKKYSDRLKEYRNKVKRNDAIVVAYGRLNDKPLVCLVFDFSFMGGSMGQAVGAAMLKASDLAVSSKAALLVVPASGGARMQEGVLSLMQMPRTVLAVKKIKDAKLPFITLLCNPTTGGVSASFAMLGDIALAEPGSTIAFTGARVIEETIKQKLPVGFQKAEYLLDHGMIDEIVHRADLHTTLLIILRHLTKK